MSTFPCRGNHTSFLVALGVALVLSESAPVLAQKKHPAEEKGIASQKNDIETSIAFFNRSQQTIKVYWLNLEGKREFRHVLKPGEQATQTTFLTHPWLLTDEQDNALGLYYPDATVRIVTYGTDRTGGFNGSSQNPTKLALLRDVTVQMELKLSEEQAGQVKALETKQGEVTRALDGQRLSVAERRQKIVELQKEIDQAASDLLNPTQKKRRDQIVRQQLGVYLFNDKELLAALRPTPEQQAKFREIQTQHATQAQNAAFRQGPPGSVESVKQLVQIRKNSYEAAIGLLTPAQKSVWQDMVGEPFPGYVGDGRGSSMGMDRGIGAPGYPSLRSLESGSRGRLDQDAGEARRSTLEALRSAAFGNYSSEFNYLAENKSIQDELTMTTEQVKQAVETRDRLRDRFPTPDRGLTADATTAAERSKAIEAALGKVLTADQALRFRQIMLQRREQAPNIRSGASTTILVSAVMYPGVAEAVKLTNEQKKKLIAGIAPAEVLTAEQNSLIAKMLGEPFKGDFNAGLNSRFLETARAAAFGNYSSEFNYLAENKSIQQELKMTADQVKQAVETRDTLPRFLLGDAKTSAERSKAVETALGKLLNVDQALRFRQIMLQRREQAPNVPSVTSTTAIISAVVYPGVAEAVKLSDEQKQRLLAGAAPADVLLANQKAIISTMLGEPFEGNFDLAPSSRPAANPRSASNRVRTEVTDASLKEMAGLKELQTLDLSNSKVTDTGLKELAGLDQLQTLHLWKTEVTDAGLRDLGGLKQLQTLSINDTRVSDAGLKELAKLKQLQSLNLVGTKVTDIGLSELAGLEQLTTLYLGRTQVTDAGLKVLAELKQLQTLGLNHTQVSDVGLKALAGLNQLQELNLWKTKVTDAGLKELAGFTQLRTLYLFETNVTDAELQELAGLKLLQKLDLRSTRVTDAGVRDLQKALPSLKISH